MAFGIRSRRLKYPHSDDIVVSSDLHSLLHGVTSYLWKKISRPTFPTSSLFYLGVFFYVCLLLALKTSHQKGRAFSCIIFPFFPIPGPRTSPNVFLSLLKKKNSRKTSFCYTQKELKEFRNVPFLNAQCLSLSLAKEVKHITTPPESQAFRLVVQGEISRLK